MASPFTNAVVASMRKLYPEMLADKAWDNTGLLLEAPYQPHHPKKANSVLLTIDLTRAVVDEAIQGGHPVVIAYHPIIFRGLKSITLGDTQQQSLLKLAGHGISVYCPHTAVDAVPGGMADWLCDVITGKPDGPDPQAASTQALTNGNPKSSSKQLSRPSAPQRSYSKPNYVPSASAIFHPDIIEHTRSVISPSPSTAIDAANAAHRTGPPPYSTKNTGSGRLITFEEEQPLGLLISRIAGSVGNPRAFPLAVPQGANIEDIYIKTIGLCPGSGSSVVKGAYPPPDLVFTGEVSHHDALAVIERGGSIISLFHSNSERGYLDAVMKPKLQAELARQWQRIQGSSDDSVSVIVSHMDRDPFGIVVLEDGNGMDFDPVEEEYTTETSQPPTQATTAAPPVESAPATPAVTKEAEAASKKVQVQEPIKDISSAAAPGPAQMSEASPKEVPDTSREAATVDPAAGQTLEATLNANPAASPTPAKTPNEVTEQAPKEASVPEEVPAIASVPMSTQKEASEDQPARQMPNASVDTPAKTEASQVVPAEPTESVQASAPTEQVETKQTAQQEAADTPAAATKAVDSGKQTEVPETDPSQGAVPAATGVTKTAVDAVAEAPTAPIDSPKTTPPEAIAEAPKQANVEASTPSKPAADKASAESPADTALKIPVAAPVDEKVQAVAPTPKPTEPAKESAETSTPAPIVNTTELSTEQHSSTKPAATEAVDSQISAAAEQKTPEAAAPPSTSAQPPKDTSTALPEGGATPIPSEKSKVPEVPTVEASPQPEPAKDQSNTASATGATKKEEGAPITTTATADPAVKSDSKEVASEAPLKPEAASPKPTAEPEAK